MLWNSVPVTGEVVSCTCTTDFTRKCQSSNDFLVPPGKRPMGAQRSPGLQLLWFANASSPPRMRLLGVVDIVECYTNLFVHII